MSPRARQTRRFRDSVFRVAQQLSLKHSAELMEISEDTVRDLDLAECRARFATPNLEGVRALAVDEKAIRKGHEYMTVVLGLDDQGKTRRVLDCAPSRTEAALTGMLLNIPEAARQAISAVAMDMWKPYQNAVRTACPKAALVFDRFHVMKKTNDYSK